MIHNSCIQCACQTVHRMYRSKANVNNHLSQATRSCCRTHCCACTASGHHVAAAQEKHPRDCSQRNTTASVLLAISIIDALSFAGEHGPQKATRMKAAWRHWTYVTHHTEHLSCWKQVAPFAPSRALAVIIAKIASTSTQEAYDHPVAPVHHSHNSKCS